MPSRTYVDSGDLYRIVPLDARCMIGSIRHRIAYHVNSSITIERDRDGDRALIFPFFSGEGL